MSYICQRKLCQIFVKVECTCHREVTVRQTAVIKETLSTDKEKEMSVSCQQEFIGKLLSDSSHSYNAVI